MQSLVWGVPADPDEGWVPPRPGNRRLDGLARTPMRLVEVDRPTPGRDGWVG